MTEYTQNENELVFLNSKNIAQKTEDIGTIPYNAIPSLSLFNGKYEELTTEDGKIKLSAEGISAIVDSLCSQISTVVDDNYEDVLNQVSAVSSLLSAKANQTSADVKYLSGEILTTKEHIDSCVNELSATVDEQIEQASTAAVTYVNGKIDNLSSTVKNSHYALYDEFQFSYDAYQHQILLTLSDQLGNAKQLSVDSTDFIKNRILDSAEIYVDSAGDKVLRLYWEKPSGTSEGKYTDIKIKDLTKIYKAGYGISISDDLTISVTNAIAKAADLNGIAATVNTLSTTTYAELTAAIQATADHADSIQEYVNGLSGDSGIINRLTADVTKVQTSVLVNVESRLQVLNNGLTGTAATVNNISSTTIPTLVEEYNELKTGLDTNTAAIGTLNTMYDRHNTAIINLEDVKIPAVEASVTAEVDARKANDSYLSGAIDDIIKDYAMSADVTAINSALTEQIENISTAVSQKLAKSEFSTLSAEIGLNAASSTNKVAVKNDLTSFITEDALTPYVQKSTITNALAGIDETSDAAAIGTALKTLREALLA